MAAAGQRIQCRQIASSASHLHDGAAGDAVSGFLLKDLRLLCAGYVDGSRNIWVVLAEAVQKAVVASLQVQLQALQNVPTGGTLESTQMC
jgi:hypothetical protein